MTSGRLSQLTRVLCSANISVTPTLAITMADQATAGTKEYSCCKPPSTDFDRTATPSPSRGGIPMVGHSPVLSAGPAHRDPSGYAAYRRCNALPRFSGSHADAFPISESSNPGTHAVSCRSPVHKSHLPLETVVAISAPLAPAPRSTHPGDPAHVAEQQHLDAINRAQMRTQPPRTGRKGLYAQPLSVDRSAHPRTPAIT
jgi:hypothetical protein